MTTKTTGTIEATPPTQPPPMEDPLRLLPRILTKLYSIWLSLTYPFASVGRNFSIHYTCDISRLKAHRIKLGNSVLIMKDTLIEAVAPPKQNGEPVVVIDDNVGIGPSCQISAKNLVHLERDTIVAQGSLIADNSCGFGNGRLPDCEHGTSEGGRIRIGRGCWIGSGVAIVCTHGELVLGRNCVVAANAVVTSSSPAHSVIIGNPGRVIRRFDPEQNAWVIGSGRSTQTPDRSK